VTSIVEIIQRAGPIMVIDPEKAFYDMPDTIERTRIAVRMGMQAIIIGGSTDNGESFIVVPAIREAIDDVGGPTKLIAFPGSSRQVVKGVHASLLLHLPQIYDVFEKHPAAEPHFCGEFLRIIRRCQAIDVPIVPIQYLLFHAGVPTSVEKATKISAINVRDGIDLPAIIETVRPWCTPNQLVFLELGSAPDRSINLGPIAHEIHRMTNVIPIVSGGINKPEHVREITKTLPYPVGFGSLAEKTPVDQFEDVYRAFLAAHPLYRDV
jgi:heptaprenylglyceryl phosphate synthase